MSEFIDSNLGLRSLLAEPFVYRFFQRLVGGNGASIFLTNYVQPKVGDRILDIGCGPAQILDRLPPVDYLGIDKSEKYIAEAKARYGDRGRFVCTRVGSASPALPSAYFDIAMAVGVIHHLDDEEATELFRLARAALKPTGRLVTLDGCFVEGQSSLARLLLRWDRGRFVRTREAYTTLASQVFPHVAVTIRHDLLSIPYTHIVMVCSGSSESDRAS